jgi:hypothetical protein
MISIYVKTGKNIMTIKKKGFMCRKIFFQDSNHVGFFLVIILK